MPLVTTYPSQDAVNSIEAQILAIDAQLAALGFADVSDQGRSISASGTRTALLSQQEALLKKLAMAAGPVFNASRWRA